MTNETFLIEDGVLLQYFGEDAEKVTVPDGVTAIGERAFYRCETVTEIILPDSVRTIGERAFMGCCWLANIVLPETLTSLGIAAFRSCDALEAIALPDGLRILPDACFYECMQLKDVRLPAGLQRISARTFRGCAVESIDLPGGLTEIEELAFESCGSLRHIGLPDSLTCIGRQAFAGCHLLSDLRIPANVNRIGSDAFLQTPFLEQTDADLLIGGDGILISCVRPAENIIVPMGVKQIGERAFAYQDQIHSVILPDSVSVICKNAFERCTALSDITLPESLRVIGDRAFEDCSSLAAISLPDDITKIGNGVFNFTPIAADGETLILQNKYLIVSRSTAQYPQIPESVCVIAGGAFSGNTEIKAVTFGSSIHFVCREAFRWCRSLEEVHIPANVQYIGEYAFSGCGMLHVYAECGSRTIGQNAFEAGQWITFTDGGSSFTVQLQNNLTDESCESALFDFAATLTEQYFVQMQLPEYRLPASVCYAKSSCVYADFLRENISAAVRMAVDRRDNALLRRILDYGFLTERQAAECAAYAIERHAFEQQVIIMRHKQDAFGAADHNLIDRRFDW